MMDNKGFNHIDFATLTWRKGSRSSGNGGDCAEVAKLPGGGIAVRDSKNPDQRPLVFTAAEVDAFRHGVIHEGLLD